MNERRDFGKAAYRWLFVACATLLFVQLIGHLLLHFRGSFFAYHVALEMMERPRVLAGWSGWALLITSILYCRVKDRLFYFGLAMSVMTIGITWKHPFVFA